MSVLVSDRTESKFEAITYSIELHDMLIDLMQRSFGVKDLDQLVRVRYAHGKDATEDFSKYRYLMLSYKNRIDQLASMLTSNVRVLVCQFYPYLINVKTDVRLVLDGKVYEEVVTHRVACLVLPVIAAPSEVVDITPEGMRLQKKDGVLEVVCVNGRIIN